MADGLGQAPLHGLAQGVAGEGAVELCLVQGNALGQVRFHLDPVQRILPRGQDMARLHRKPGRQPLQEGEAVGRPGGAALHRRLCPAAPDGLAVLAPVEAQRPAGQRLPRIPLALSVVQHAAGAEAVAQPLHQLARDHRLGGAGRRGVPLRRLEVIHGDEGRLAPHGQTHVPGGQVRLHLSAERVQFVPHRILEGFGDADRLHQPGDGHLEAEVRLRIARQPGDRRAGAVVRRGGERQVPLPAQEAGGGVEADPAGAGDVDLRPGVQVGEVLPCAHRPLDGVDVRHQLDQVAADEPGGEAQLAQHLHQQPGAVAAGAGAEAKRLVRGLHPRLHPHQIAHVLLQGRVQPHQEVDGAQALGLEGCDTGVQQGPVLVHLQIGDEIGLQVLVIGKGQGLGIGLDEEVEGIDHLHLGGQVDGDAELPGGLWEHQPRQPVAVGVLLPVDEVLGRDDLQGIAGDHRRAVGRRAQAHHVGPELHRPVVAVPGDVVQGGDDRQFGLL